MNVILNIEFKCQNTRIGFNKKLKYEFLEELRECLGDRLVESKITSTFSKQFPKLERNIQF